MVQTGMPQRAHQRRRPNLLRHTGTAHEPVRRLQGALSRKTSSVRFPGERGLTGTLNAPTGHQLGRLPIHAAVDLASRPTLGVRSIALPAVRSRARQLVQSTVQWGEWAPSFPLAEGKDGPGDTFVNLDGTTGQVWIRDIDGYATNGHGDWDNDSHPMTRRGKHRAGRELDGRTWDEFPKSFERRASV